MEKKSKDNSTRKVFTEEDGKVLFFTGFFIGLGLAVGKLLSDYLEEK